MKKSVLFLTIVMLVNYACSDDDGNHINSELKGDWSLISISCFCPENITFEQGAHVWDFNFSNYQLEVNNNPAEEKQQLETGTYDFTVEADSLKVMANENLEYTQEYEYEINKDTLLLMDHPELDGPILKFVRN